MAPNHRLQATHKSASTFAFFPVLRAALLCAPEPSRYTKMILWLKHLFRKKELEWYEPEDPTPREQCPCCDYITLPERGNYLICPICFWEDDGQDIDELDLESSPNHGITLRQGRANFKAIGACEEGMIQHVLPEEERKQYEYRPRSV